MVCLFVCCLFVVCLFVCLCLEVYSRGKLSSDNDSFHTDVFSDMPHNSSIVFDVIEVNNNS